MCYFRIISNVHYIMFRVHSIHTYIQNIHVHSMFRVSNYNYNWKRLHFFWSSVYYKSNNSMMEKKEISNKPNYYLVSWSQELESKSIWGKQRDFLFCFFLTKYLCNKIFRSDINFLDLWWRNQIFHYNLVKAFSPPWKCQEY